MLNGHHRASRRPTFFKSCMPGQRTSSASQRACRTSCQGASFSASIRSRATGRLSPGNGCGSTRIARSLSRPGIAWEPDDGSMSVSSQRRGDQLCLNSETRSSRVLGRAHLLCEGAGKDGRILGESECLGREPDLSVALSFPPTLPLLPPGRTNASQLFRRLLCGDTDEKVVPTSIFQIGRAHV